MAPPKRKYKFHSDYEREFQGIKKSKKGDEYANCVPCNFDINLESMGKAAILVHQKYEKHKRNLRAMSASQAIQSFMPSTSASTEEDRRIAAAEGVWAYHLCRHAQSFKSSDCVSSDGLFRTMFSDSAVAKKFGCAQKKAAKIITGVLAPFSVQSVLKEVGDQFFSISLDSSNHKTTKLFPIVVRYFVADKGIQVRLLDLQALPGETSEEVYQWIIKMLQKHGLKFERMIAFCADNTAANFGSAEHRGENNVFYKLKAHKNNLIPVGCPAHVLHNAAKRGADNLPIDIESIVFKLASHFKNSTKRVEQLHKICDEFEANYMTLTAHGPTRWTTLSKIVDKIVHYWEILENFFSGDGPLILRNFFNSQIAKVVLYFLCHVLPLFNASIDALQRSNAILPELLQEMNKFKSKIWERKEKKFYGMLTGQLMRKLTTSEANELKENFQNFLKTTLDYVDKWFRLERFPKSISWVGLEEKEVQHTDVLELASEIAPELEDKLFDEITDLNRILSEIPHFVGISIEEKWKLVFRAQLPNLYVLVSKILAIPVSNAFVERIFSLCGTQWTDKRNLLEVETVKSLVQVKVNFDQNCSEMFKFLISKPELLRKIVGGEKYVANADFIE